MIISTVIATIQFGTRLNLWFKTLANSILTALESEKELAERRRV